MKKNFWKENGILISLYGVVGVLVVTAGILTVSTLTPPDNELAQENVEVQSSLVDSYRNQVAKLQEENQNDNNNEIEKLKQSLKENNEKSPEGNEIIPQKKNEEDKEDINLDSQATTSKIQEHEKIDSQGQTTGEDLEEKIDREENKTSSIYEENDSAGNNKVVEHEIEQINKKNNDEQNEIEKSKSDDSEKGENLETSKLTWPIEGAIVMNFNNEALVYDETLNLYRTNESISITADKGDEIVASADGKIIEIGSNVTDKGYVVIDHGNGYSTKYSQLVDKFIVKKGDEVRRGQIIGHIGEPTSTFARQGTHLQYTVAKNNVNIDPLKYLE